MTEVDAPIETWRSPRGVLPKQTDDVRTVELTLTISTPGALDRKGRRRGDPKTDAEVLEMVKKHIGATRDTWPRWLRSIDVDGIYLEDGDDEG